MKINPAIVVSAYNRPYALQRLLTSIASAVYDCDDITLIISIDNGVNKDVIRIAEQFEWKHGSKKVIDHTGHLGLKRHILFCGKLSATYSAVIVLEDDLLVSPYFYSYAIQAYEYYKDDLNIGGISLYNYQVAESCFYPFKAIDDDSDVYFMQVASSWGQLWTKDQWQFFEEWLNNHPDLTGPDIPEYLKQWGPHSWKKHFIHYLIATSRYFVYPQLSLSTNFEEPGTNATQLGIFQVPLQLEKKSYRFRSLSNSHSVYDAFFEALSRCVNFLNPALCSYNYEVDLYGTKEVALNSFTHILTSKTASDPEMSFSSSLVPLVSNVALNLPGARIGLFEKSKNKFSKPNLHLYNYLDGYHYEKRDSISAIIPVKELNLPDLQVTINSITGQDCKMLECIVVANASNEESLRIFISSYQEKLRLIISEKEGTVADLLALGFQQATNEIITWVFPGNFFYSDAFKRVQSTLKLHPTLSWVAGLDYEPQEPMNRQQDIEFEKYRLSPNLIYEQLQKNKLNPDTQLHFFRKHCTAEFTIDHSNLHNLFFQLSNLYQFFLMVYQPGVRSNHIFNTISAAEAQQLLITYKHFKSEKKSLTAKIANILLKSGLITGRWGYAFRVHFESLPDVLRFDELGSAYLNRY